MRKTLITIMAAIAALASCQKNEITELQERSVITAHMEQVDATRTIMDEDNNIRWSEGDQIVAFMKTSLGRRYQVQSSYVGETFAAFDDVSGTSGTLTAGTELSHNVAYYPYASSITCEKSGPDYVLNVTLPAEQAYKPGSFGNGSFPMAAASETNEMTFRNICGGMKLQFKGTQKLASIKIEGKNSEKLSGAAVVTAYTDGTKPSIRMASDASASVTLDCGEGVQLNENTATEFIITIPPVVFSKGFTVTVTDTEGYAQTIGTDKSNEVKRSSLLVMPEISIDAFSDEEKEPQEGDYIDEYGINHGQGIEIDGVVWAPVNCGYHPTDYKYGKLYQWGRKYGQGYNGSSYKFPSDSSKLEVEAILVSLEEGQLPSNAGKFYCLGTSDSDDWTKNHNINLWNSGSEDEPIKTEYDPCPDGWRVPTKNELGTLFMNKSEKSVNENNQDGYWFSGQAAYSKDVAQIFLPAAGYNIYYSGEGNGRTEVGSYWSSYAYFDNAYSYKSACAFFNLTHDILYTAILRQRAYGSSVRCVKE